MVTKNTNTKFYILFSICPIAWAIVFFNGYTTAIDVWLESEIYNHCFFVIPCSLYFIYAKRFEYKTLALSPAYFPLILLLPILLIQLFAQLGDIKVLMHMATFTSLPLLIWALVGNDIAKKITFPLGFILFSIPIGDQLVPHLQELTTDISVPLLKLTGVPVFRNGLYIDIPEGQFLVAEACSGISFLISTIVFGFFYAYISFNSIKKRVIFIAISIVVPLLANALRVYGIILTGHLTDMEHAVGADHLVYGGVFFGIVLFILIIIGERYRDVKLTPAKNVDAKEITHKAVSADAVAYKPAISLIFIFVCIIQQLWLFRIGSTSEEAYRVPVNLPYSTLYKVTPLEDISFSPNFSETSLERRGVIEQNSNEIEFFIGYYSGVKGELVSSGHRLFDQKLWSRLSERSIVINNVTLVLTEIVSVSGKKKTLVHWYEVDGKVFSSQTKTKLYQTFNQVIGERHSGSKIVISYPCVTDGHDIKEQLRTEFDNFRYAIHHSLATL